jgi:hypothetical protein
MRNVLDKKYTEYTLFTLCKNKYLFFKTERTLKFIRTLDALEFIDTYCMLNVNKLHVISAQCICLSLAILGRKRIL